MADNPSWTLVAASARFARERPGHTAVICQDRRVDYAWMHRQSNQAAHALRAAGAAPGTRVAWFGRESEYYYTIFLACAKVGAVLVPVNWRLTAREVTHILGDSGAAVLCHDGEFAGIATEVAAGLPTLHVRVQVDRAGDADPGAGLRRWWDGFPDDDPGLVAEPGDAVVQIYTSGTTGLPKGAVVAHRAFFTFPEAQRAAGVDWIDFRADDVSLISLPGLGTAGITWFWMGFSHGLTNVVMRMFVAQEAVRLIQDHRVTITFAAPAMLRMMIEEKAAGPAAFVSMRKISYGGAPIPTSLLLRCLDVFGCEFAQIYASTESANVAVCLPPEDHKPGPLLRSAGRVCPGNELKIIDSAGRTLPPGEIGQVCVRTPSRMLGYWNLGDANRRTIVDGWLLMGDTGYVDENGYLFVGDRINDTIIVAGQNVYPAEVEIQLAEHPAVADAAVVGVPDERWGETVQACVVLVPGADVTARELTLFLRGRLADYKIPYAYHFIPVLDRNPAGKVLRRAVRERLRAGAAIDT